MKLATTLRSQPLQNRVREVGINPNYWYPVGWSQRLKPGAVMPVVLWEQPIAVYRTDSGVLHALENACPHKGIELHKGEVKDERLVCPYHGWEFDGTGSCVNIPYFPPDQKLPCARARRYAVREKYGIIWLFPGDARLAEDIELPDVPEFGDRQCLMIPIEGEFGAHFSICNENTMDVFHGYLHKDLQGWFDPQLISLSQTSTDVRADYKVSYQGWITKVLGLGQSGGRVTTRTISIHFSYPHYHNSLEGLSSLYVMRLPISPTETKSFSLLFLNARLPKWMMARPLRLWIAWLVRRHLFMPFLTQDIDMIESEYQTYMRHKERQYVEVNPAIVALQRTTAHQYSLYLEHCSPEAVMSSMRLADIHPAEVESQPRVGAHSSEAM